MSLIDINSDLGEGSKNDYLLMPLLSSCNIACGGHYGNEKTISKALDLADKYNVKIGAHPSFPDLENFGRKLLDISEAELTHSLQNQLQLFSKIVKSKNLEIHHIKPHGALYNEIFKNKNLAEIFVTSLSDYLQNSILYVPFNSEIDKVAKANNIVTKYEAFADRNYNNDLSLVSRQNNQAMIIDTKKVEQHVLQMIQDNKVQTISGQQVNIKVDTLCIHSDTQNSYATLKHVAKLLSKMDIYAKR